MQDIKTKKRIRFFFFAIVFTLVFFYVGVTGVDAQVKFYDDTGGMTLKNLPLYSFFDRVSTQAGFESAISGTGEFQLYGPYYIQYQIAKVIGLTMMALGLIFLGIVFYGGIIWMTAKGNEEQVKKGRDMIKNGAIGVVIVTTAYITSYFVARNALNISQQRSEESLERTGESILEEPPLEDASLPATIDSIIQFFGDFF